ncbi:MAG: hypothetical protein ABIY55_28245 [Kofleriaceae bacterium]
MLTLCGDPSTVLSAVFPGDRQRLSQPTAASKALRSVVQAIAIVIAASAMFLLAGALVVLDIAATILWMPAMLTLQGWIAGCMLAMMAAYSAIVLLGRRARSSHGDPV